MVEASVRQVAEEQLGFSRRLVELGDTSAIVQAVRLCIFGELPIPDWLAPHVEAAMLFYFREGGAEGKGRKGGNLAQFRNQKMHRERHRIVQREIARGGKQGAYERAAKILRYTFARGQARQMADSYRKVEANYARLKNPN